MLFDIVTHEGDNLSLVTSKPGGIVRGGGGELFTQGADNRWDLLRLYKSESLPVTLDRKAVFNLKYYSNHQFSYNIEIIISI